MEFLFSSRTFRFSGGDTPSAATGCLLTVFSSPCQKPSKTFMIRSSEVETVKLHDFVPRRYKVVQELLQGVLTSVDFRQGPELGVRTED